MRYAHDASSAAQAAVAAEILGERQILGHDHGVVGVSWSVLARRVGVGGIFEGLVVGVLSDA